MIYHSFPATLYLKLYIDPWCASLDMLSVSPNKVDLKT
jgi:hypothetical protein